MSWFAVHDTGNGWSANAIGDSSKLSMDTVMLVRRTAVAMLLILALVFPLSSPFFSPSIPL